jgi:hypothetical protein
MNWIKNVDHITYACVKGMIEKWAWYHIEVEGGRLVKRIDDISPNSTNSSMKLWCIAYNTFGIALVEGIDRAKKSQVSLFTEKHGDHSIQHVAYNTEDLDKFIERLKKYSCQLRGDVFVRNDGFGIVKQVFTKGHDCMKTVEMTFSEYVERAGIKNDKVSFSQQVGKGFYQQIEEAENREDKERFIDFLSMPTDWQPPAVEPM